MRKSKFSEMQIVETRKDAESGSNLALLRGLGRDKTGTAPPSKLVEAAGKLKMSD